MKLYHFVLKILSVNEIMADLRVDGRFLFVWYLTCGSLASDDIKFNIIWIEKKNITYKVNDDEFV